MKKKKLGEIIIEKELLTEEQLDQALVYQKGKNKRIGKVLLELGYLNEIQLAEAITKQFSLKMVDCNDYEPSNEVLSLVRKETAEQKLVFPLEVKDATLVLAMANPLDWETIENISFETGLHISVSIASENNILGAIEQFYGAATDTKEILKELPEYDNVEFIKEEEDSQTQTTNIKALYEFVRMDSKLKRLITGDFTTDDLWQCAKESGTKTMLEDAWMKVKEGITTLEEVLSKIPAHELSLEAKEDTTPHLNKKVLLFDDDEAEMRLVRSALEGDGYQVLHSTNGDMLEMTSRENPFLIIINNTQKKLEAIRELRNIDELAYTPVLCLSDPEYKDYEAEGFGMGINDFLYRPVHS